MWPTPTPFPQGTPQFTMPVDIPRFGQDMASGMVQGWQVLDAQPWAAFVWFILLFLLIILGVISIKRHLESLNGG